MSENAKIQVRGEGIGEIDNSLLLQRATEIARNDGRQAPNDADIAHAREELLKGYENHAPETSSETEQMVEWDETPLQHGTQAAKVRPEDDGNVIEELVLQGNEEAEHDLRVESGERLEEDSEEEQ